MAEPGRFFLLWSYSEGQADNLRPDTLTPHNTPNTFTHTHTHSYTVLTTHIHKHIHTHTLTPETHKLIFTHAHS